MGTSSPQSPALEAQILATPDQATPIPMDDAVFPPANFRDITYPGLPDAVAPFNTNQTAHARSIIPAHFRSIVENSPTITPLAAKKGARVGHNLSGGRTEPD